MTIQGTGPLLPNTPLSQIPLGFGYASDLRIPVYRRWVAALQRDWKQRDWLSLSYSGMAGSGLLRRETILNPTPALGQLNFASNDGISSYHGFHALYKRSLLHGLQANVTPPGRTRSTSAHPNRPSFNSLRSDGPATDRGPSDFDVRHTLNLAMIYSPPSPFRSPRPAAQRVDGRCVTVCKDGISGGCDGFRNDQRICDRQSTPQPAARRSSLGGSAGPGRRPEAERPRPSVPRSRALAPWDAMPCAASECGRRTRRSAATYGRTEVCEWRSASRLLTCSTIRSSRTLCVTEAVPCLGNPRRH